MENTDLKAILARFDELAVENAKLRKRIWWVVIWAAVIVFLFASSFVGGARYYASTIENASTINRGLIETIETQGAEIARRTPIIDQVRCQNNYETLINTAANTRNRAQTELFLAAIEGQGTAELREAYDLADKNLSEVRAAQAEACPEG